MKIGIFGCGQMGVNYTSILTGKLGVRPTDIVVYDIVGEKQTTLANNFGTESALRFPNSLDAAIVAASTPAHAEIIVELARGNVRNILCEKPLGLDASHVKRIRSSLRGSRVYTALVINSSHALSFLKNFMAEEGCRPLELSGYWGKPRPLDKNVRPSAGDVEDESVHPIAFALALMHEPVRSIGVTARVGNLPFVDPHVQAEACARDPSFPAHPNHSTTALLTFHIGGTVVPVDIRSSFLLSRQIRQMCGVLGSEGSPTHLFEVNFDQRDQTDVGDVVTIVSLVDKRTVTRTFSSDKLADLTESFLDTCAENDVMKKADPRLADVNTASALVDLHMGILQSSRRGTSMMVPMNK